MTDAAAGPALDASVVVCTFNRAERLGQVLADLAAQSGLGGRTWEVVVVDNNSSDETRDVVSTFAHGERPVVRYLFEGRQGKAFALNSGIRAARGAVLAFTDDDVRLGERWLGSLLATLEERGCLGAGGAVESVWTTPPPPWLAGAGSERPTALAVEFRHGAVPCRLAHAPVGANCAYRREAFERFGWFRSGEDGREPMPVCEDTEFGRRLLDAGEAIWYVPAAVVLHPVDEARLTRRYLLRWHYLRGRAEVIESGVPAGAPLLLGVPRYLYRTLLRSAADWLAARDPRTRFARQLRVWETAGEIAQHRRGRPA